MMNATERQSEQILCLPQIMTQYSGVIFENCPEDFGNDPSICISQTAIDLQWELQCHIAPVLQCTNKALDDLIASNPIYSCSPATQHDLPKLMAVHRLCAALTTLITDVGREPEENFEEKISSTKYCHKKCLLEEYFVCTEDESSGEDPNVTPSLTKCSWVKMFYSTPLLSEFGGSLGLASSFTLTNQGCTPVTASTLTDQGRTPVLAFCFDGSMAHSSFGFYFEEFTAMAVSVLPINSSTLHYIPAAKRVELLHIKATKNTEYEDACASEVTVGNPDCP
eukprot:jgi/Psemu1/29720/gm1.29720_g